MVKELILILGVQGSKFMNDICCGQHWNIDRIFLPKLFRLVGYIGKPK